MFSLNLIMSLDLTPGLQRIWGVEDHGKIVPEETVRQKHEMGPSVRQLVYFQSAVNFMEKKEDRELFQMET